MSGLVAAVTAVGTAASLYQQNRANQQARAANRRAARIEAVRAQRERTQALRQMRVQTARVEAQAGSQGLQAASPVLGAVGALQTSQAAEVGFANMLDQLNQQRMNLLNQSQASMNRAAIAGTLTQAASSVIGSMPAQPKTPPPRTQDYAIGGPLGPNLVP